jgi:hypothetical protein
MTPRQFLWIGSVIFIALAILGFTKVLGPTVADSIFRATWWFDNGESWAYLVLGILAIIGALLLPVSTQKSLAIVVGMVSFLLAAYSIFVSTSFLGANLEYPADTVFHLALGAAAFIAAFHSRTGTVGSR